VCTQCGQPPADQSITTGDVKDGFAGPNLKESLGRGPDELVLELVAIANLLVPPACVLIPDRLSCWGHGREITWLTHV
jgi:hypothetical protein